MDHPIDDMLWDLTFLYDSSEAEELKRDFSSADKTIEDFRTSYRGCIASLTAAQLKEALRGYEALHNLLVRPQTYAYLLFAADSEDPVNKKLSQRSMEFANKASQELLFFDLEIIDIPDNRFNELIRDSLLAPYGHYLEALRRYKPHTLPEREERLLKQKSLTGIEAFTPCSTSSPLRSGTVSNWTVKNGR